MRLKVIREGAESVDWLSPVERGFERWLPALQLGVRTLALIGFCSAAIIRRGRAEERARLISQGGTLTTRWPAASDQFILIQLPSHARKLHPQRGVRDRIAAGDTILTDTPCTPPTGWPA